MSVRFLLFRGNWENEGNFCLLETEKTIVVLAAGKDFSLTGTQEQQIGRDYLKENRSKVKAIIVNNTSWQNIGLLEDICHDIDPQIPIYTSFHSKLILSSLFPHLGKKMIVVEKNKELKVGDFFLYFLLIGSYQIGNLALKIDYFQYSFYFLEAFVFSGLLDSKLLFPPNFLLDFQQFLTHKKKNTYLITSCQGMHWKNSNSLFFADKSFSSLDKPLFFILYDFDWLHILELLEIVRKWGKKLRILDENFVLLIRQILVENSLREVISKGNEKREGDEVYLLVSNPENIRSKLDHCLSDFSLEKKNNFHFVVGIPPVIGSEEKIARLIDYLYTQSQEITNLVKKEYLSLGVSFYDFKLLLQLLQPIEIITLQNIYKNEKFFSHLPGNFFLVGNGYSRDFSTKKSSLFETKKTLINLEELLVKQRKNLGQSGLLIILIITEWKENKLQLKKLKIESLAISSLLNFSKLESKIRNWWATRLIWDIKKSDPLKITKKVIERRLSERVKDYLTFNYDIDLEELLVLLFNHKKVEELKKMEHTKIKK